MEEKKGGYKSPTERAPDAKSGLGIGTSPFVTPPKPASSGYQSPTDAKPTSDTGLGIADDLPSKKRRR